MHLLGNRGVGKLLAGLGTPLDGNLLADQVVMVVELQDLDSLRVRIGILFGKVSEETLGTAKEVSLMTISSHNLEKGISVYDERLGI